MKKFIVSSVVFICITIMFDWFVLNSACLGDYSLFVSVTSSDSLESLMFEGSYLFKTQDSQLFIVKQKTPFVVHAKSDFVIAILKRPPEEPGNTYFVETLR